jgi:hypothetical protein
MKSQIKAFEGTLNDEMLSTIVYTHLYLLDADALLHNLGTLKSPGIFTMSFNLHSVSISWRVGVILITKFNNIVTDHSGIHSQMSSNVAYHIRT